MGSLTRPARGKPLGSLPAQVIMGQLRFHDGHSGKTSTRPQCRPIFFGVISYVSLWSGKFL